MFARLVRVYGIIVRRFGFTLRPIFTFFLIVGYRAYGTVAFWLDPLFFPSLRKKKLERPVFIVGNPRSGTTFLHRWLVSHGIGAGFELWQLLWPSLTARTLVRPFVKVLERVSPARFHGTKAHPTSLTSVETDDVLVFFRFIDGLFLWGYCWAWDDADHLDELDPDGRLGANSPRDFGFLREALRRNLVWHGKDRAVAKLFSMSLRPEAAFRAFPDARMLYIVRDPVDVIPSGMSLVMGVVEQAYPQVANVPAAIRARYLERLYQMSVKLYLGFAEAYTQNRLPADQVFIVRYDEMMADFESMMTRICAFIGQPVDDALRAEIVATANKQRKWQSEHAYDLAKFNLDADRIRADLAMVYQTWGLPLPTPAKATAAE